MRNPLLLIALVASLAGCSTAPKQEPVSASHWVDEQILQSAGSISQAQQRLYQTRSARSAKPSGR